MSRGSRIQQNATTTGTGTFDLGTVVANFVGFIASPSITTGDTVEYWAVNDTDSEWEHGEGVITDAATDTLSRVTVFENHLGTTAKVNFTTAPVLFQDISAKEISTLFGRTFRKMVTDTTDIALAIRGTSQSVVGSSFSLSIPAKGWITAAITGRFLAGATTNDAVYFGLRISGVNYWFGDYDQNGTLNNTLIIRGSNVASEYRETESYTTGVNTGTQQGLNVEAAGLPTGDQTVEVVLSQGTGDNTTVKGTTTTTRVSLWVEAFE
jgi:hypothetical protein